MQTRHDVCAVVVTYNRKEKLKKCIECLMNQVGVKCDIEVVNNASTDGTEEMMLSEYAIPGIYYHNTCINLGGAGGFEIGVKNATLRGYKYIWIMDDDTWPENDALYRLITAGKEMNDEWGFLSSVALWTDGSICKANTQKKNLFKFVKGSDYDKKCSSVQFASFVSLLVKSSVVRELGLPIGEYFIWTDDYEYTGRISRQYKGYMIPGSKVKHAMDIHRKANIARDDIKRIDRYRFLFRNDVNCYRQYGFKGWTYIVLKDLYMAVCILLFSDNKKTRLAVLFNGFINGCGFYPTVNKVE